MRFLPPTLALFFLLASCADPAGRAVSEDSIPPESAPTPVPPRAADAPLLEEGPRLEPVDEGTLDPSFQRFREDLRDIVRDRDAARLMEVVDPAIRYSFGNGGGVEAFREQWELDRETASPLWKELGAVLDLGGAFLPSSEGRMFFAPYTFSSWPDGIDGFQHLAIICEAATVRESPEAGSLPIVRLRHHVLRIGPADPSRQGKSSAWREVVLPGGRRGWVRAECARSHIDYRAGFERKAGEWRMALFVAGD